MRPISGLVRLSTSRALAATTAFVLVTQAFAASAVAVDAVTEPPVDVVIEEMEPTEAAPGEPAAQEEETDGSGTQPPAAEEEAPVEQDGPRADEAPQQESPAEAEADGLVGELVPAEDEAAADDQAPADGGVESETANEGVKPAEEADSPEAAQLSDPAPLADQADVGITPFAAGDATIRVFKGADRVGTGCSPTTATNNCRDNPATGLEGAVFEAYAKGNARTNSIPGGPPLATCTSDANGVCNLLVDSALGPRYVVREVQAPAGFRAIGAVALGGAFDSGTPRDYVWNVEVRANQVTPVPRTEIRDQSGQTQWTDRRSSPTDPDYQWADARDNPPLPPAKCGLNVAMLFDLSGSIGSNLPRVKTASTEFIDDLTGTPTSIALFTFSTQSPQNNGNSQNRPTPISLADPNDAAQVKGWINGFSNASGGTNWDAGLRRVAAAGQAYDVLIVLTDGNPTAWEGDTGSTGTINDYDVENAVHSANWVKLGPDGSAGTADDTRIVGIGLSGQSGGLTALNLEHISGTVQNDDYYLTTFGDLADVLTEIALNGCGGTINVQKRIAPSFDEAASVAPEANWPFSVDPEQRYVTPPSGTTGPNGEPLTFQVTFDQGELARDVTISEPDNFQSTVPVQDAGKNARCFLRGQPLPPDRIQNEGDFGFTVTGVTNDEIISCLVVDSDAQLQAIKYEDTNGNGSRDPGEPGLPGWTVFLDENNNAVLDGDEESLVTDDQGEALFERLAAPEEYHVCEVLQAGWFNTDPGGGALCKTQQVNLGDSPAGPVEFGNVQAGGFTIEKSVTDETETDEPGFVPDDTEYTVEVDCTPADQLGGVTYPVTLILTDGESATVGPLIDGTTCEVSETDSAGAVGDIQPTSAVTIPDDDGIEIVVDNTYPAGVGQVVKVVDGPLAGELAPPGTEFEVEVSCTFPLDYPVQGPIPGYDPTTITVESGPDGQPGPAVEFGPLPVGSECTAVESDENGADPFGITPDSVIITEPGGEPVQFVASNTYRPAALRINKVVEGDGAALVPPDTVYVADVVCTFLGETTFDGEVEFGVNDPGIVSGQPVAFPVGTECTVTEADSQGATWSPQTQTVQLVGPDPVLVDVTITNTFDAGGLTVEKVVDDPSGLVAVGTQYTVNVACTFGGQSVPGYPQDVVLTYDADLSQTLTGLPYGTECVLTEPDLNGAGSVTFEPGGGDSATVTIDEATPDVTVTATNTYPAGTFPVSKRVAGEGASFVPAGTEFEVTATCTLPEGFPGEDPAPFVVTVTEGSTVTVPPDGSLPVGTVCSVEETDGQGAGSSTVVPDEVTIAEGIDNVEVIVTNTYDTGGLIIEKVIEGPSDLAEGSFEFDTTCTFLGSDLDPQPATATITPPATSVTVDGLPVGAECSVVELAPFGGADGPASIDPGSVVVGSDDSVTVTATNTFTAPPQPPQPPTPPTTPQTGVAGLVPLTVAGASLVATGALLVWWSVSGQRRRRRSLSLEG